MNELIIFNKLKKMWCEFATNGMCQDECLVEPYGVNLLPMECAKMSETNLKRNCTKINRIYEV